MPKLSYYSSERYCPHAGSVVLYSYLRNQGVINVLYQKNKEQKNSITVGTETSNSDLDESESDTDNEEEFGTVIEDDDDTNINSEKELSFGQKLELAITQKISTNQNTGQKAAVSKTIGREIDLSEDEGFRGKYLEKKYIAHC
ncbi:hypothetical protein TNCV_5126761 [Trichonephila clavipes]|nr:hypothetical protein TNCV_5126761 [Trichonephila clavipes]